MSSNKESCNLDELKPPEWLNTEYLTEILAQYVEESKLKVTNLRMTSGSAKGDNYSSVMTRASVDYTTPKGNCTKSLIIKTMSEQNSTKKDMLGESHIFSTEIAMYSRVLPKFEAILRASGDDIKLYTECVYYSMEPRQVMIFEDLVSEGYNVIRNASATLNELRAALEKLAKWHVVSYKLLKEQPEFFQDLQYDLSTLPIFLELDFITSAFPKFMDMLDRVDSLRKYKQYFEPMRENLVKRWADIMREYRENRQESGYYVLCHGDIHLKNMMFRGDECMLLDFQMSYVGSMANDVLYAVYTLFGSDERRDNCDELIFYYFDIFLKTLSKIGYQGKMPCLLEFRRQMFNKRFVDFFIITTFLPSFIRMRKGLDPYENPNQQSESYFDEDYQQQLEYLLPRMLHLGYFEQLY